MYGWEGEQPRLVALPRWTRLFHTAPTPACRLVNRISRGATPVCSFWPQRFVSVPGSDRLDYPAELSNGAADSVSSKALAISWLKSFNL